MQYQEQQQDRLQAQNFTATVSHEMRTPLETTIFFLEQVLAFFAAAPLPIEKIPQSLNYCTLMMG